MCNMGQVSSAEREVGPFGIPAWHYSLEVFLVSVGSLSPEVRMLY